MLTTPIRRLKIKRTKDLLIEAYRAKDGMKAEEFELELKELEEEETNYLENQGKILLR